jgi:hypothetical protein
MPKKKIPFVAFSNDELAAKPRAKVGQKITCPRCNGKHKLEYPGDGSTIIMFYRCGDALYLGALDGALVIK